LDNELTAYENMQLHTMLYGQTKTVYQPRIKYLLELVELTGRQHDYVKTFGGATVATIPGQSFLPPVDGLIVLITITSAVIIVGSYQFSRVEV